MKPTLRHRYAFAAIACITAVVTAGAQQPVGSATGIVARTAAKPEAPKLLPGTRPAAFTTIQGNALTSTNGHLSDSLVRLRDARYGRIVAYQTTDKTGLFTFRSVDPGTYIVEIVGRDQTVLAASQLLTVNAGDAVSAVVKLPFNIPPFADSFGTTSPSRAAAVTTLAAANGVLSTVVTLLQPVSP